MVVSERDDELTLFLELRRREKEKEKEKNNLLLRDSDVLAPPLGSNGGGVVAPVSEVLPSVPPRKTATEKFLYSENDKSDYDWLLTPPGTPLLPMETRSHKSLMNRTTVPSTRPTALKQKLENLQEEPNSMSRVVLKNSRLPSRPHSSDLSNRKASSTSASGAPKSYGRPATPNGRPTMVAGTKPLRSMTPSSRASFPSTRPAASTSRAITPSRSSSRSSTPTSRPSAPSSKLVSRSATPTRQPMTSTSFPSVKPTRSSSVPKSAPNTVKNPPPVPNTVKYPPPARALSPTVKSRPWKPSEMPGFSLDAPPNLRTSIPDRPTSATRGRPGAPGTRSSSIEAGTNGRPRRQSCSPSRVRPSTSTSNGNGSSITSIRRRDSRRSDNESPVSIGTKMVERVVNMRKLAPPRQVSSRYNPEAKLTSSMDGSSFGSTLSKKSLDMAMRHMDIRRSISTNGSLRPLVTKVPASSVYSVRSRSTRSRTTGVSDSPLATSSNASSEPSVNNNFISFDGNGSEMEDVCSERGF